MSEYKSAINEVCEQLIENILEFEKNSFEILKVYVEYSTLYEEIEILLSHNVKKSLFQNRHKLYKLKYDFPNNCGVLYSVANSDVKDVNSRPIKFFGEEHVLIDKGWI